MRRLFLIITGLLLVALPNSFACLWDDETLVMESQRFPDVQDLISGSFVRHSTAYYEWRISDRTAKPYSQRTPLDYDDIAVSYDKLGQHDKAIETIRAKMERWPNERLYESEANVGTFHIHAGNFQEGLTHINRAIAINPDAHFGREIYQKLLVEYVIEARQKGNQLPLSEDSSDGFVGFAAFVLAARKPQSANELDEIHAGVEGVLGMMRFGSHDSPILLEALGDLLRSDEYRPDSKTMAAFAYWKASVEAADSVVSAKYRNKAETILNAHPGSELSRLEGGFKLETEWGDRFFRQIVDDESAWVASGINVDTEFAKKYYDEPARGASHSNGYSADRIQSDYASYLALSSVMLLLVVCGVIAIVVFVAGFLRRKNGAAG